MLINGRLVIMTLGKAVLYIYKSLRLANPRLRKHLLEKKKTDCGWPLDYKFGFLCIKVHLETAFF